MKLRSTLLAAAALLGMATVAQAAPITGAYTFTVASVLTDTVDASMASSISFAPTNNTISTFTPFGFSPSLTACTTGNCGTIANITNIGTTGNPTFTTGTPLFTVQGLSFTLTSLSVIDRRSGSASSSLELVGNGVFSSTVAGYTNTNGVFDITIQNGSTTMRAESASASGSTNGSTVPEPASLALLGGSLAAVGLFRRRSNG